MRGREHRLAVRVEMRGIANDAGALTNKGFQPALAFLQRQWLQVLAVDREEVKREEGEAAAARPELLQPLEARASAP